MEGRRVSARERFDWLLLALKMEGDHYPRDTHHF